MRIVFLVVNHAGGASQAMSPTGFESRPPNRRPVPWTRITSAEKQHAWWWWGHRRLNQVERRANMKDKYQGQF